MDKVTTINHLAKNYSGQLQIAVMLKIPKVCSSGVGSYLCYGEIIVTIVVIKFLKVTHCKLLRIILVFNIN